MQRSDSRISPQREADPLLPYVTDLEFEVDRLRKQGRFIEEQAWVAVKRLRSLCGETNIPAEFQANADQIKSVLDHLASVLVDLHQHPGYHPAHDQVVPIAVRPLIDQVFRWHQRLTGDLNVSLRLELEIEYVNWFPGRLRHIIDNLLANALRHGATDKGEGASRLRCAAPTKVTNCVSRTTVPGFPRRHASPCSRRIIVPRLSAQSTWDLGSR